MIRSFRPDDLPSLMDLWLSGNLEAHAFIPPDHWHRHTALVARLLPQAELSIYETGGHIAGFAGMTGHHLSGLFVRSTCRSTGIGRALLTHLIFPIFPQYCYAKA